MTNIDRAADIVREYSFSRRPDDVAQALADATPPLLMPDLPVVQFAQDGTPYWEADGEVYQPSLLPGFIDGIDAYGEPFRERVEDIKEKALAMLAAADYIERNQA